MNDKFDKLITEACELVVAKEAEKFDKILAEAPEPGVPLADVERSQAFFDLIDAELQKDPDACDDARIRACSDVEAAVFEQDIPVVIDVTGTPLCPGHPEFCLGSDHYLQFDLCCDACDHFVKCFPEWEERILK